MTWFNTRTIDISSILSYTDKHTKRTTDSIKQFIEVDIERSSKDKKFV